MGVSVTVPSGIDPDGTRRQSPVFPLLLFPLLLFPLLLFLSAGLLGR